MIPDKPRETILEAIAQFDETLRNSPEWLKWEQNENHKYAIEYNGQCYPVKKIISMATGVHLDDFTGGVVANGYVSKRGFNIIHLLRNRSIKQELDTILSKYITISRNTPFSKHNEIGNSFELLKKCFENNESIKAYSNLKLSWSSGMGNWSKIPWFAFLDSRETTTTQKGVYCVFLFREDMSGVYLALAQGVTEPKEEMGTAEARNFLRSQSERLRDRCKDLLARGFSLDNQIDLHTDYTLGTDYEYSTIAYKLYETGAIPEDTVIEEDLSFVLSVYNRYISTKQSISISQPFELGEALKSLIDYIDTQGYVFEPWQVAAYITALRTKPFVILAGITGTGKSKLPALIAKATGNKSILIPVRPDWTDSADILGYCNLKNEFQPGAFIKVAQEASKHPENYFVCILDEMNLARVEHYFAEILSKIEDRHPSANGGFESGPLLSISNKDSNIWSSVILPPNMGIVGTVNMDESTHSFSRKVLDRAFTIELSDVNLSVFRNNDNARPLEASFPIKWPSSALFPQAIMLGGLRDIKDNELEQIHRVIDALNSINIFLKPAQLQVGYRTRDEIALFVINALPIENLFITRLNEYIDPLDLAIQMKILPRIIGGNNSIRRAILQFLGWANKGNPNISESEADTLIAEWENNGCTGAILGAKYPRTLARLCLMWGRLQSEGFTSFWL